MPGSPSGCGTYSQACGPPCGWPLVRTQVKATEPSSLPVRVPRMSSSAWNGHTCRKTDMITAFVARNPVEETLPLDASARTLPATPGPGADYALSPPGLVAWRKLAAASEPAGQ